jgi:signal transduction histidine kinase
MVQSTMLQALLDRLPRGYTLEEEDWQRRHRLLLIVLALHVPGLAIFDLVLDGGLLALAGAISVPLLCLGLGWLLRGHRRTAAVLVTAGLSYSSAALVVITAGSIEAHFHFFIIIGFIALYQDWAPFLFNILFTVVSHGLGSVFTSSVIFSHLSGQNDPWLWSLIHGIAVLLACVGMMLFWRITEESQQQKEALARRLAEAEIGRRQFASDMLVNLARRNQGMVYRQLDIINQLEESEQDPDALAELFKLDHLATRVRRNAESLLVLSGEQPARVWSDPIPLRDVVRAAIAETEDLDRVVFLVGDEPAVAGSAVTDLTHLLAELIENAVRFSPPDSSVTIRARPDPRGTGAQLLTVEDWGVGMPADQLEETNRLLADPPEVDLSVSKRLGFHVVARLAARHDIGVTLYATPGSGITAAIALPAALFDAAVRQHAGLRPLPTPVRAVAPGSVASADGERMQRPVPAQRGAPTGVAAARPGAEETMRLHAVPDPRSEPVAAAPRSAEDEFQVGWWGEEPGRDGAAQSAPSTFGPSPRIPAPAPSSASSPQPRRAGAAASVARPAADLRAVPAPRDEPGAAGSTERPGTEPQQDDDQGPGGEVATEGAPFTLRRRVPQAHLTPELRQPTAVESPTPTVPAANAASALSRYQASRQAARDVVDGPGDAGGNGRESSW